MVEADIHIAGTPCVDFSSRGTQEGEEGSAQVCFMCWLLHRAAVQEAYIIHENVPGFQVEGLSRALGRWYDVDSALVCPSWFGWPITRKRRYTVLRHKVKSLPFRSPWSVFTKMFFRSPMDPIPLPPHADGADSDPDPPWACFMVASAEELSEELEWASTRPSSKACVQPKDMLRPYSGLSFYACLTEEEEKYLREYELRFPGCAYSLNQSPSFGATHSSKTHLQCLIKNLGILWKHRSKQFKVNCRLSVKLRCALVLLVD